MAPFTITWLIANAGSIAAPSYYLAAAGQLSSMALVAAYAILRRRLIGGRR